MDFAIAGFDIVGAVVVLGAITGMAYGVLAAGLVLVYRSNKMINFAHGSIGGIAAAFLGIAVVKWGLPYWVAFALALALGAAVGGAAEVVVVRRLHQAPIVVGVIATIGLGQFLSIFSAVINSGVSAGSTYPQPTGFPTFDLGPLRMTPAYTAMLFVTPGLVAALAYFLLRGRLGLAMRAAASNADAARMAGVVSTRMSTLSWAIAGGVAAYTAILVIPTRGFSGADFLGPGLLLRALVCAVVARMVSLPIALATGVLLGVIEQLLLYNYPSGGLVEAVLFVFILLALLTQRARTGRSQDKGSWAAVLPWAPLPESYQRVFAIRNLGRIFCGVGLVLALMIPMLSTNSTAVAFALIIAFALVGLSVGIVTGLAGQLSLGQFALAGVGATAFVRLLDAGVPFPVGVLAAGLAAAATSLVLGVPALRIQGLMLAVTSMGFALAAQAWLFGQSWMLGTGIEPRTLTFAGLTFDTGKRYFFVALTVLVFGLWLARNIWQGGLGRRLRAVRDNEDAARAFTVPATAVKLQAFVLAGFLAGLGGAVYAGSLSRLSSTAFPLNSSINSAAVAVVGGLGILIGPLLGALYIIGVPKFLPLDDAGLAATSLGWLILVLQLPGGIAQGFGKTRNSIVDGLARRAGLDPSVERQDQTASTGEAIPSVSGRRTAKLAPVPGHGIILKAHGLSRAFGGVQAVKGVSLEVRDGETLGLIGPNGAGKTTLFEILSGYTRPDEGIVEFDGRDVTRLTPERRAQLGLVRSFQDAALFPTMTVLDVVTLSLERVAPTRTGAALLGLSRAERQKAERARELVDMMGLHRYRTTQIRALSTGTRRIAELACLIALEPRVLLLDEPTSGIAQRETEALGDVLMRIKDELGLTLIIIEHDIPLVMSLSDRIVAMEAGSVLIEGPPSVVRNDPAVITSYLGGDLQAIERSTQSTSLRHGESHGHDGCRALTNAGVPCRRLPGRDGWCAGHRHREEVSR